MQRRSSHPRSPGAIPRSTACGSVQPPAVLLVSRVQPPAVLLVLPLALLLIVVTLARTVYLLLISWAPREYVFCEQVRDTNLTGTRLQTMVRSNGWKVVHFLGEDAGQLFALKHDPKELTSLWDDPDHAQIKAEQHDVIFNWHLESRYKTRNWCAKYR